MKSRLEPSTEEHSKPLNFSCNLMHDETVPQEWQFPSKFLLQNGATSAFALSFFRQLSSLFHHCEAN